MSKFATAATVRAWAAENDLTTKAGPGRLSKAVIEAFNADKGNRAKYRGAQPETVRIVAKPEKGRAKVKTAETAEVRAFAVANGLAKPGRGRLSTAAKRAYVLGLDA